MKLQAIFFTPLLLYILVLNFEKKILNKYVLGLVLGCVLQLLIILPFCINGDFKALLGVISNSVGDSGYITSNAYNIWAILIEPERFNHPDSLKYFSFSFYTWGQTFFYIVSFAVLIIPFIRSLKSIFKKEKYFINLNEILLIGALIPLIFFFFNTQMHERYSHPAFIFIVTYSLLNRKYGLIIISSIAYFLNLEGVAQLLSFDNYHTFIFTPWVIAILYLITLVLIFFDFVRLQKTLINLKNTKNGM
jgi:hypothetical protein